MAGEETVRRQERGRQQMARILDAAVVVFARDGVARATTNAVAAEAAISPGSLYQYYRNKDDLLAAIGRRYAGELDEVYRSALTPDDLDTAPIADVLDQVIDPIMAFKNTHAAFVPLFARADLPAALADPVATVDSVFTQAVADTLARRNPAAGPSEVRVAAVMMINLFRGAVATLGIVTGDPDDDLVELKLAMTGYLERKNLAASLPTGSPGRGRRPGG